jgi:hypothetical protein
MRKRSVLLFVPALVAGVVLATADAADATLPSAATHVGVTSGNVTSAVDGHLHPAASIAGRITQAGTTNPLSASVAVYLNGKYVRSTLTDGSGTYLVGGLAANSYAVCVSGVNVFTSSSTGFLGRCYKTAAFNGSAVPGGATLVTVTNAQHKTGINIGLPKAAAIAGKVTSPSGTGLSNVFVSAHNRTTGATFFGFTASNGTYSVKSLTAAAKGYTVCFSPFINSGTGFLPRCYKNKSWSGGSTYPSTATAVSVALGHVHTGISQVVPRAGAISGKVIDAGNGHPVPYDGVLVFTGTGRYVSGTGTNAKGQYIVRGLRASSTYRVCASPTSPTRAVTYHGKCWKAIAWNGGKLPAGTTAVGVHLGSTHTGISFKLSKTVFKLGSIAGTVTEQASGQPLQSADVTVFSGNVAIGTAVTDATGHYNVSDLRASSTGYVVCVSGNSATSVTPTPATGWAPRCHTDVAWTGVGVPSAATKVPLSAGQNKTGIDIALHVAGEIDGTTFVFGGSTPALGIPVYVYTTGGRFLTSTSSSYVDGSYSIKNLSAPGNYIVCFDGRDLFGQAGYLAQCYDNVAWNGSA